MERTDAEGFVSVAAELTVTACHTRPDCDTVALVETRLAAFDDHTRGIASRYMGHFEFDTRKTAPRPDVEVVERRRLYLDEHLAFVAFRLFTFGVLYNVTSSVFRELDRFHTRTSFPHTKNLTERP